MEITKQEMVTRTYCDVCGYEVTHANSTGSKDGDDINYVVCMSTHFELPDKKGVRLNCEQIAKLYTNYPQLMNDTFRNRGAVEPSAEQYRSFVTQREADFDTDLGDQLVQQVELDPLPEGSRE